MSEETPQQLGRFEVVRELGRGAMGVVYEGRDPKLNRRVAIKTARRDILAETESPDELMARFVREAQAAAALNHPNIVTVYDAGEEGETAYIAMEYLEGEPLSEELETRIWSPEEAVELTATLCRALHHAHERGVIHRDIKPSNIMQLEDGSIRIADFGIARLETSTLTQTGAFFGTPHYMSPEQCLGQHVDGRADLFAAGIILYQLLTNERPFPGKGMNAVMHSVLNETPRPPDQLNPHVSDALCAVTLKALRKKPGDRYPDGEAMAAALEESLKEAPDPGVLGIAEADDASSAKTIAIGTTTHGELAGEPAHGSRHDEPTRPASAPPRQESPAAPENAQATRKLPVAAIAVIGLVVVGLIVTAILTGGGESEPATPGDGDATPGTDVAAAYDALREGKLAEAEQVFREIALPEGLAAVAYERGDLEQAIALSQEAGTPYAKVIQAQAFRQQGRLEAAREVLETLDEQPELPWQRADAAVARGRLDQAGGHLDDAIASYGKALEIDPDDVVALSNQGAAYRESGNLEKAEEAYAKAKNVAPEDNLVALALRQIQREMAETRDAARRERIQQQIRRLGERAASQADEERDDWTTRPLVVAVLPGGDHGYRFERAGVPLALRRELQAALMEHDALEVVEREALEAILREQDIASSELADPVTQRKLGGVLAASHLVFAEFIPSMSVTARARVVETQTTDLADSISEELPQDQAFTPGAMESVAERIAQELTGGRELKGLIADASDPGTALINIGEAHGVQAGARFLVYGPPETIEVGGRSIERLGQPIGTLTVTEVSEESALAQVNTEGAGLEPGLRIKEAPPLEE